MDLAEIFLGSSLYEITEIRRTGGNLEIRARYEGPQSCPRCKLSLLLSKGWYERKIRHLNVGSGRLWVYVRARKLYCKPCGRCFRQPVPGFQPRQRSSEAFQRTIFELHLDGINRSRLGRREGIGAATVERYFQKGLRRQFSEWHPPRCPTVLGIDEHFFTRRKGYATTFCDLRRHKVYDVVLGR